MDEIPPVFQGKRSLLRKVIAIYCRISQDDLERGEGVENQKGWGLDYAAKHWPGVPVEIFSDNNLTAADPDVYRPEFERLRRWVREGRVLHIWAVEQSRLVRLPEVWFPWARELTAAGIDEIHTRRQGVVIVQSEAAGINVVIGGGEVNRTKTRIDDTLEANALKGKPPGSRPAGYRHARVKGVDTYEVVEEEWRPLLRGAKLVLDGWSVGKAAEVLVAKGLKGAHRRIIRDEEGNPVIDPETGEPDWRPTVFRGATLRKWLTSPTVAGLRVHQGQVVGRGNWPPLLCDDPHAEDAYEQALAMRERLLERLGAPREVITKAGKVYQVTPDVLEKSGRPRRRYLLTGGKLVCGLCRHAIVGGIKQLGKGGKRNDKPYYWCTTARGGGGCVGMLAEVLEDTVRDRLHEELAKDEFIAAFRSDPHAERREALGAELGRLSPKRKALAASWAADAIDDEEWAAARGQLDERETVIRAELATIPPAPPRDFDPRVLRNPLVWEHMVLGERRAVIDRFVESVTLWKARTPDGRPNAERIAIVWKVAA